MPASVAVVLDYVCPFCFLAEFPLRRAVEGRDVTVEWMPFELRPEPAPTLRPEEDYLTSTWRRSVYPLAEGMGVPITLPSVSPQPYSRLAFEGLHHARARGLAGAYNDRVFRAFFQEDRDIGDPDVLADLAAGIGLDAEAFRRDLRDGMHREAHREALKAARALGVTAVPTFVVNGRAFTGLPRGDRLERLIADAGA